MPYNLLDALSETSYFASSELPKYMKEKARAKAMADEEAYNRTQDVMANIYRGRVLAESTRHNKAMEDRRANDPLGGNAEYLDYVGKTFGPEAAQALLDSMVKKNRSAGTRPLTGIPAAMDYFINNPNFGSDFAKRYGEKLVAPPSGGNKAKTVLELAGNIAKANYGTVDSTTISKAGELLNLAEDVTAPPPASWKGTPEQWEDYKRRKGLK